MDKELMKYMAPVYKWRIKDGKVLPPKFGLPKCVTERIQFFHDQMEDGLTFYGALTAILAINEPQVKHDVESGGFWLPKSGGFDKWLHGTGIGQCFENERQETIALALLYGWEDKDEDSGK